MGSVPSSLIAMAAPADPLSSAGSAKKLVTCISIRRRQMPYTCSGHSPIRVLYRLQSQTSRTNGFDEKQAVVSNGSDYTIGHADLAPGEVVNFKVALHDPEKLVKFVKITPCVAGSTDGYNEQS